MISSTYDNYLLSNVELVNIKKIIILITTIIITSYIIIQIILLTQFTYNYVNLHNYGYNLKKICKNNNNEYETSRYQLYNNLDENIMKNDNNNKNNYILIIALSTIFSILFSLLLTYVMYIEIQKTKKETNSPTFYNILTLVMCLLSIIYIPLITGLKIDKKEFDKKILNYILYGYILLYIYILFKNNNKIFSNVFLITLIVIYLSVIHYTNKILDFYINKITQLKYNNAKNNKEENIFVNYLLNIFGLKHYYNSIYLDDYYNFNIYIYYIEIVILFILILLIINKSNVLLKYYKEEINIGTLFEELFYKKNTDSYLFKSYDVNILYNLILIPLIALFVIFVIINATKNVNTEINNNIIYNPLELYKQHLFDINSNFTNILSNDNIEYKISKSVDKNIANSILLILYNDIFYNILNKKQKYIEEIDITPEFKYTLNNKNDKIEYNKLKEYDIIYYLNNKNKNRNIFYTNNDNKQCSFVNRYIIYDIIKNIFLYSPVAEIEAYNKNKKEYYDTYKLILKYKIYFSINNIINKKNYLGKNKLDFNNNIKNNNKLTKDIDTILPYTKKDRELLLADIETIKIKKYEILIDSIIDEYINYIIETQELYYLIYKSEYEIINNNEITITDIKLKQQFYGENYILDKNHTEKINKFVTNYKNIISNRFKNINNLLSSYNDYNMDDYSKTNKLTNYIKYNYNLLNDTQNSELTPINLNSLINKKEESKLEVTENYSKLQDLMANIILQFYFNHNVILKHKNKYNKLEIKELITLDKEDKRLTEYVEKLTKLIIILKGTINNHEINNNIIDNSLNDDIVNDMINFDEKYKIDINENIEAIKYFSKNTQNIYDFDMNDISKDYIKHIQGLNNKILFYNEYVKKLNLENTKYDEKNRELINNIVIIQRKVLNGLEGSELYKLNYNEFIDEINYETEYNMFINNYKKFYNILFNIKITENISNNDIKLNTDSLMDVEYSKKIKKETDNITYMVMLLVLIYIIIYVCLYTIR